MNSALRFPELGFYALAGAPKTPRVIIDEMRDAERLGLGTAFISERLNVKESATLTGAAAAASSTVNIATAATNLNTRHPLITAAHASTMHALTGGRYTLGLGRGFDSYFKFMGLPGITTRQTEEFVDAMRRIWRGETVVDYEGPLGRVPAMGIDTEPLDIPLGTVAFGPKTLALGGRLFDAVILHTYFSDETLSRSVKIVKTAAEQAGRDPGDVTVWSCFATLGDHLSEEELLKKGVARLATYLQGYGDLMVETNGWDRKHLERFRADELVQSFRGPIDGHASIEELKRIEPLIPAEWLSIAATGSPTQCVTAIEGQLALGADAVILHGASPAELEPIVDAYGAAKAAR